tara:strand:+ start:1776 stop:2072 length:297 start_codon:yes stop_codon:yes gene_type:complete
MTKYSEWEMLDGDVPLPIPNDYNTIPINDNKEIPESINTKDHEIPIPIHEDEPVLFSTSNEIEIATEEDIVDETDKNIRALAILFICVFFLIILLNIR